MDINDCFELGHIDRPNGLKGVMNATIESDAPQYYQNLDSVFILQNNSLVPHFIEELTIDGKGKSKIKLEDIDTVELAETYRSAKLFLPLEMLPSLEEGAFYYHDIVGYEVEDLSLGMLGIVNTVYAMSANDLLSMQYHNKEVLIPVNLIVEAKPEDKRVIVDLPDGLLSIYLEDQ